MHLKFGMPMMMQKTIFVNWMVSPLERQRIEIWLSLKSRVRSKIMIEIALDIAYSSPDNFFFKSCTLFQSKNLIETFNFACSKSANLLPFL